MNTNYAKIGSISSGTHRLPDLVDAFLSTLESLDKKAALEVRQKYPTFSAFQAGETAHFDITGMETGRANAFARRQIEDGVSFSCHAEIGCVTFFFQENGQPPENCDEVWDRFSEEASDMVNETLHNKLSEYAPPFCYFGPHEGDGADFGFWFSQDLFNTAVQDKEVVRVPAEHEWRVRFIEVGSAWVVEFQKNGKWVVALAAPDKPEFVAEINDHGNLTLKTTGNEEVYSCV